MTPLERKVQLTNPKSGSPDWDKGKGMIKELVEEAEEDEILELIDPSSFEYGGLLLEPEEQAAIAEKVLLEDLLVLQLDLANKRRYIQETSDGYLILDEDPEDHRTSFSRAARLIHFCVLDDAVGYSWAFL